MATLTRKPSDERGVVYVEFLIAFGPVFLLFLAICQLALLSGANLVVRHAAYRAARSAIVVLEDAPDHYSGEPPRGSLSSGDAQAEPEADALFAAIGLPLSTGSVPGGSGTGPQKGARMAPIRLSAYLPLLTLSPRAPDIAHPNSGRTLSGGLVSPVENLAYAFVYTRSASAVTLHTAPNSEELAEQVGRNAAVTVRVTYLFSCSVPLVRTLMCRSLPALLPEESADPAVRVLVERMRHTELPVGLAAAGQPGGRFRALSAEVTLPNQGAAYDAVEGG